MFFYKIIFCIYTIKTLSTPMEIQMLMMLISIGTTRCFKVHFKKPYIDFLELQIETLYKLKIFIFHQS